MVARRLGENSLSNNIYQPCKVKGGDSAPPFVWIAVHAYHNKQHFLYILQAALKQPNRKYKW